MQVRVSNCWFRKISAGNQSESSKLNLDSDFSAIAGLKISVLVSVSNGKKSHLNQKYDRPRM
jgi:hypothetical protein